jgi:hypothetical protein
MEIYGEYKATDATTGVILVGGWVNFINGSMFGDEKSSDHCLHWNYDCFVLCVAAYML